jgi:hypothetical protein
MKALVVEPPHPLQGCELDLLNSAPRPSGTGQLGLMERVDCLSHRVVVEITDSSP